MHEAAAYVLGCMPRFSSEVIVTICHSHKLEPHSTKSTDSQPWVRLLAVTNRSNYRCKLLSRTISAAAQAIQDVSAWAYVIEVMVLVQKCLGTASCCFRIVSMGYQLEPDRGMISTFHRLTLTANDHLAWTLSFISRAEVRSDPLDMPKTNMVSAYAVGRPYPYTHIFGILCPSVGIDRMRSSGFPPPNGNHRCCNITNTSLRSKKVELRSCVACVLYLYSDA